jgi:hypothetical protein
VEATVSETKKCAVGVVLSCRLLGANYFAPETPELTLKEATH